VWKGHWLRTYLYDILYSTILCQNFIDKTRNPMVRHARRTSWESILDPFAVKYHARRKLGALVKIQRQGKDFLNKIRKLKDNKEPPTVDKEKKKVLKSGHKPRDDDEEEKPKETPKVDAPKNLADKVKRVMRVRIFHDLLFATFNKPINELKSTIFKKIH